MPLKVDFKSEIQSVGKLLWQLFSNKKHPVSQNFWKKYLHGGTLRNLKMTNTTKGSITWNLCRKHLKFFSQHLYRIPGNGRHIFLWDDKINGNAPLVFDISISEIKSCLINKGLFRLADIILWDSKGNWDAWSLPNIPYRDLPIFHAQ